MQIKDGPQPYITLGITNVSFRITGWNLSCVGAAGYIPYAGGLLTFFDIIKTVNSALYATTSFINNHGNSPQTVKSAWLHVLSNSKSIGFYIPANPASRY